MRRRLAIKKRRQRARLAARRAVGTSGASTQSTYKFRFVSAGQPDHSSY